MPIPENDITGQIQQQVLDALANQSPLFIHGGKTKQFYGNPVDAQPLDISAHTGIISYEPTELCITVRAGTPLVELESLLAANKQILTFEPPHFFDANNPNASATIGGAIAAGIAGPRRAYTGSVRDAILGVQMINGNGEIVNFGGQVMKNVAGYDISRLMVRSQGTLGVILAVSLRLLPKPSHEITLCFEASQEEALKRFHQLKLEQHPVTASAWFDNTAYIRLSASEATLAISQKKIGGEVYRDSTEFWKSIRDQYHPFFNETDKPLWRFSLPPAAAIISRFETDQLIEWGGAQRWVHSRAPANILQSVASARQGYATLFRGSLPETPRFPLLDPNLMALHKSLKHQMDPSGLFNPNRIYYGL